MKTSEQIDQIAPALIKAQAASKTAKKDAVNPHFRSHYADLGSVWEAVSDALAKNGLAVIQAPGLVLDGALHITTRIIHTSGQWIESEASTPLPKLDPQGYGSAVTYMRRYTLAALLGVVAGEDDDGNAASEPNGNHRDPERHDERPAPRPSGNGKGFASKFDGTCASCGIRYAKGDPIMKHATGYGHVMCPDVAEMDGH